MEGGEFYRPLRMHADFPGIDQLATHPISEIDLPDATPIIGVEVGDQACAFVVSQMAHPQSHIINLDFNGLPLSVSYCDLQDKVRVVCDPTTDMIDLNVGGLDVENQLVLLHKGRRYGQMSPGLPLDDYAFTRMNLGQWKLQHPSTRVCISPILD